MLRTIINTPWPKLMFIAGALGMATGGMGLLAHRQRRKLIEGTPFLRKALEMIKQREILDLLGTDEPDFNRPALDNPWSKIDSHKIRLVVPVKGPKDKASLYIIAERKDTAEKYRVTNIAIEFKKIKGKKLIVMEQTLDEILAEEANSAKMENKEADNKVEENVKV